MGDMRRIAQPGPAPRERIESAVGRLQVLDFTLEPGLTLNAAITGPLIAAGMGAAQVEISDGGFGPFTYVMPAASSDATHAAWYSAPFAPAGETRLERGNVTFGRKEGAPFIHCHAFWIEPDGSRHGGHIMPHETVVAAPIRARAYAAAEVETTADFDAETNFPLFTPHARIAPAEGGPRIAFARVRPNVEIGAAVEELCRRHGFAGGHLRGGVGSLIGARFADAPTVDDYATEVFVTSGTVAPDASGALAAQIDLALVSLTGAMAEGRLVPGANPVLITFELAVEEIPTA
ncbi:PCC domain-containing protein [Xanthobacter versatilis]|uniref:PCC domain-containing protein n=1 Tax=Xanthobacter autotrophicus (strain ATCC BAA-1158 / Py2) TaxID=78245 RepID=UPI003726669F